MYIVFQIYFDKYIILLSSVCENSVDDFILELEDLIFFKFKTLNVIFVHSPSRGNKHCPWICFCPPVHNPNCYLNFSAWYFNGCPSTFFHEKLLFIKFQLYPFTNTLARLCFYRTMTKITSIKIKNSLLLLHSYLIAYE